MFFKSALEPFNPQHDPCRSNCVSPKMVRLNICPNLELESLQIIIELKLR